MYDRSLDLFAPHVPPDLLEPPAGRVALPGSREPAAQAAALALPGAGTEVPSPPGPAAETGLKETSTAYGAGWAPGGGRMYKSARGVRRPWPWPRSTDGGRSDRHLSTVAQDEVPPPAPPPPPAPGAGGAAAPPPELRSNFAETAFWQPHLLTDRKAGGDLEFTVPDSVTSWNVWVHAVTAELPVRPRAPARRGASKS